MSKMMQFQESFKSEHQLETSACARLTRDTLEHLALSAINPHPPASTAFHIISKLAIIYVITVCFSFTFCRWGSSVVTSLTMLINLLLHVLNLCRLPVSQSGLWMRLCTMKHPDVLSTGYVNGYHE